jgi:hypothetical protein
MLLGTAIIIGSVALVNSSKLKPRSSQLGEPDLSTVKVGGD